MDVTHLNAMDENAMAAPSPRGHPDEAEATMLGISFEGPRLGRRHLSPLRGRKRHRVEAVRESLPQALDEALGELKTQAQPVVDRALRRKQRRSKKPLALLLLLAAGAVVAYLLWNRRDQEPAYLAGTPDEPDATPDASPSPDDGGHAMIPGRPDVNTGTIPSAIPSVPRPVAMPSYEAPVTPEPATSSAPQMRASGAASWDLPSVSR